MFARSDHIQLTLSNDGIIWHAISHSVKYPHQCNLNELKMAIRKIFKLNVLILLGSWNFMLASTQENDTFSDDECLEKSVFDALGNKKTVTCLQVDHPSGRILIKVRLHKNNRIKYDHIREPRQLIKETNCSIELVNTANNCTISVNNKQFLEIHDAFATLYSINEGQHAAFLEVSTLNGSVMIGGLMTVRSSRISSSKFLPFTLARIPDIMEFKVSTKPQTVPEVNISIDMSLECLSQLLGDQVGLVDSKLRKKDEVLSSVWMDPQYEYSSFDYYIALLNLNLTTFNDSNSDFFPSAETSGYDKIYFDDGNPSNKTFNYSYYELRLNTTETNNNRERRFAEKTMDYSQITPGNDTGENITYADHDDYCFKQEGNETHEEKWYCTAGHNMPSEHKDMIMMALYTTFFVNLDTVTITRREIVPASDFEVCSYTHYTRLYPAYVANYYAEYGLQECCKLNMFQLEIYGAFSDDGIKQLQWECQDPYSVTTMIQRAIIVLCAIMTVFCPMMVKFFPSPHEVEHGNLTHVLKQFKLTTQFLQRYVPPIIQVV